MSKLTSLITATLLSTAAVFTPVAASAAESPNVLIMNEDADKGAIPRSNRASRAVLDAMMGVMNDRALRTFEESALTYRDQKQGRQRRPDHELVAVARAIDSPPMDVMVAYTIYVVGQKKDHTTEVKVRIPARMRSVHTGELLYNFEVSDTYNAHPDCKRDCMLETITENARALGAEVGGILAQQLDIQTEKADWSEPASPQLGSGRAYELKFEGFNSKEMIELEDNLQLMRGYEDHEVQHSGNWRTEIWYEIDRKAGSLKNAFVKMLDSMGYNARVSYRGRTFVLQRITQRGERRGE